MKALDGCYSVLGISPSSKIKHPGNPSAFANFINVNEAFVEIIKDFECRAMQSGSEDPEVSVTLQKCEEYIPGDVDIKALAQLSMENRLKGTEDAYFKTNLAIYDNDTLVVTGTSYFLWLMDNYKEISGEVARVWEEDNKAELAHEEDSHQETLAESGRCCEFECKKISDRVQDIDNKIGALADRVMIESQSRLSELQKKYSSIESKLDEILQRLDSPTGSRESPTLTSN